MTRGGDEGGLKIRTKISEQMLAVKKHNKKKNERKTKTSRYSLIITVSLGWKVKLRSSKLKYFGKSAVRQHCGYE